MWKPMLAGTVVLVLSGSGLALAQQRPAPATPQTTPPPAQAAPAAAPKASGPSAEERAAAERQARQAEDQAEVEGRIASLKARLMLTDEQAKNWPAFEKALRDFVKVRMEQRREFRGWQRSDNPLENMQARAEFAVRRGTAMKEFTTAALPFYNSLDQNQQRQFRKSALRGLVMMMRGGFGRDGYGPRWGGGGGGWGDGPRSWGDRGDNDGGCGRYGHHGWHHRGGGMMGPGDGMGPRGGMMGPGDGMGPRGGMMGPGEGMGRRGGMMGQRWSDGDDDDQRGGNADEQSDSDDDNGSGRSGSQRLSPDEERF